MISDERHEKLLEELNHAEGMASLWHKAAIAEDEAERRRLCDEARSMLGKPPKPFVRASAVEGLVSALQTIRGSEDRGPWMLIYREAGGGYEGLQAIAEAALAACPHGWELPDHGQAGRGMSGCIFCRDAGPDFDYCRVCGRGETSAKPVEPMKGLRLAVRLAKGGPLFTDGSAEVAAYHAALKLLREQGGER